MKLISTLCFLLSAFVLQAQVPYYGNFFGSGGGLYGLTNAFTATNTAPIVSLTNVFVLGTRYTNATRRAFISQSFTLTAAVAGTAAVTLSVEQGSVTNLATISAGPLASLTGIQQLSMMIGPSVPYTFLDASSGSGATVSAVTNTATWIGL